MRRALPLLLAIGAFVAATIIWTGSSRVAGNAFDRGSISNTSPTGLSLAYAYLGSKSSVKTLTAPLGRDGIPHDAVVFRIEESGVEHPVKIAPHEDPDEKLAHIREPLLTSAEDEFVRRGGRLVLASDDPGGSLQARHDVGRVALKVFPLWPGLDRFSLPQARGFAPRSLPGGMHTLFAGNGEAIVARQELGAGEVIVVSVPEVFENQNIGIEQHLALLGALAGKRPVYFDEVVHGMTEDEGILALLTEWRLGPLLVLAGIASLLVLWRGSRRIGPADDEERDRRSGAIDLVASLGALYGRSMSDVESITLYHEALSRSIAAQSGLRGDALQRRMAELMRGLKTPASGRPFPTYAFNRHLTTINDAFRTLERSAGGGNDADHR